MITISIFYYAYLIIVLIFIIGSLFNIYHLLRFGFSSLANILVMLVYVIVASAFLMFTFEKLSTIDWEMPLIGLEAQNESSNSLFYD